MLVATLVVFLGFRPPPPHQWTCGTRRSHTHLLAGVLAMGFFVLSGGGSVTPKTKDAKVGQFLSQPKGLW